MKRPENPINGCQVNNNNGGIDVYRNGEWSTFYSVKIYLNNDLINTDSVNGNCSIDCSIFGEISTVTMGGVDITSSVVSDNAVNISEVTGDIEIRIVSILEPPAEEDNTNEGEQL